MPLSTLPSPTTALALATALFLASTPATGHAQDPGLDTEPFLTGLSQPIDLTNAGDGSGRLFVHEKGGRVKAFAADGTPLGTFLDLSALVSTNSERGLLGLAFAPDYATSGRFYVNYSDTDGDNVIARYTLPDPAANDASAAVAEPLLTVSQPYSNHNGGDLAFGPDGLLYVASGDGGSGNDPQAYSQNLSSLLGKILRLDVSGATGYLAAGGYTGAAPEVYAAGLRNPWRMSFDGNDLYIGDVGQNAMEEIDRIDVTTAVDPNFGWVCFEGSEDNTDVPSAAQSNCQPYGAYEAPYFEYAHNFQRRSVTGGVVYRGAAFPELQGFYLLGDFAEGNGFAVRGQGATQEVYEVPSFVDAPAGFGTDEAGEVYVVSYGGTVERVVASGAVPTPVTVASFEVVPAEDCRVEARWTSAEERDLDYYEVQLAGEDMYWEAFAKTAAAGDGTYATPLTPAPAARYARLSTVDLDGSSQQTSAVVLPATCASRLAVYPTLLTAGATATVTLNDASAPVEIVDAAGRTVTQLEPRIVGGSVGAAVSLPTAALPAGMYVVRQGGDEVRVVITE